MSCSITSTSRQPCKKRFCTKACCTSRSQFFTGPRTLLQDLSCGSNCDAPLTVEAWSGGEPGAQGATVTTVGLELCDKLVFWSESLDISVAPGSAVVNIESGITGVTGTNVGGGAEVYKQTTGQTLEFRTLIGGTGIGVVQNTNDITIGISPVTDDITVNYTYNGTNPYNSSKTWNLSKIGKIVYLNINEDQNDDLIGWTSISINSGTIPPGFRPVNDVFLPLKILKVGNGEFTSLFITASGIISVFDTGIFGAGDILAGFANTFVSWICA